MTKRHADDVTVADIVRLRKENEELQQRIRYQEHRDGAAKGKTHSIDCYDYGPSHYECALQEIERLREEVDELVKERNRYKKVCLKIVSDSKEESDISDFVLYLAKEALKESE